MFTWGCDLAFDPWPFVRGARDASKALQALGAVLEESGTVRSPGSKALSAEAWDRLAVVVKNGVTPKCQLAVLWRLGLALWNSTLSHGLTHFDTISPLKMDKQITPSYCFDSTSVKKWSSSSQFV